MRRFLPWRATYAARVTQHVVHRVVRHPTASLSAFTCAAIATLIGTFLPWLRSGSRTRTSYDLLGVLSRLEFAPGGVVSTLVHWWPVVPLLITAAVVAGWWRWTWPAVVAAAISALYAGGVGVAVTVASHDVGIELGPGPVVCALGGAGLLLASLWLTLTATGRALPTPDAAPLVDRS